MKTIINANIVLEHSVLSNAAILFDDTIRKIIPMEQLGTLDGFEVLDAGSKYVLPGLIDLHIHGIASYDAMDASDEAIETMARAVAKNGVTRFLPTTMSMPQSDIAGALQCIRSHMDWRGGAIVEGAHAEGPFVNLKYKGAQNADFIAAPDFELVEPYLDVIKIITLAPETDKNGFIELLAARGTTVSMGHSAASFDEAMEAIGKGVSHVTHLFNAMSPLGHREPGVVGAALMSDVTVELIADTIHVRKELYPFVLKNKGADKIILVSDSMSAAAMGKGEYSLGGQKVYVDETSARLSNGALAGSILALNKGVANFQKYAGLELWEAVRLASLNPAKKLGIHNKTGSLQEGKKADIVIADEELSVYTTFVEGESVYSAPAACINF